MDLDQLKKLGLAASIGLFVGILATLYIGPNTTAGAALLITLCVLVSVIVGQVVSALAKRRRGGDAPVRRRSGSRASPRSKPTPRR